MRLLVILSALLLPLALADTSAYTFSPADQKLLAQARQLMEQYAEAEFAAMPKYAAAFAQIMDGLAASLQVRDPAEIGETALDTKLATIALDRKLHPQRYRTIAETYIFPAWDHGRQANLAPPLDDEHIGAEYRLAWEYYLLAPVDIRASAELYDFRIAEALGLIGNELSLVSLREAYRLSSMAKDFPVRIEERQALLLRSLNHFASSAALNIMLECIEMSAAQSERLHPGRALWQSEEYILRLLSDQENYGNGAEWRQSIEQQNFDRLLPKQRRLLQNAVEILRRSQ